MWTIDDANTALATARTQSERRRALIDLRSAVEAELAACELCTIPPEPLGCREWRAFFDPEGVQGFGKTENEAIRNLVLDSEAWDANTEDGQRIALAFATPGECE